MRIYHGQRIFSEEDIDGMTKGKKVSGTLVVTVNDNVKLRRLSMRTDLSRYHPAPFEVGTQGDGPKQLAIAILADCIGDAAAMAYHSAFTESVLGGIPKDQDEWVLTESIIRSAIQKIKKQKAS